MPAFCSVVGCGSRGNRDKRKFYTIPNIPTKGRPEIFALKSERRMRWILALRRKDLTETKLKYALICSRHFVSGRPARTRDVYNIDWVPTLHMGYDTSISPNESETSYTEKNPNDYKGAIICYVTASDKDHSQCITTGSEVVNQNEDSQSSASYSSGTIVEQREKQDKCKDATVCYLRPYNAEQSQINRTESVNQYKDPLCEQTSVNFQNEQPDSFKNLLSNRNPTSDVSDSSFRQILVKRTIGEITDQFEDSWLL